MGLIFKMVVSKMKASFLFCNAVHTGISTFVFFFTRILVVLGLDHGRMDQEDLDLGYLKDS